MSANLTIYHNPKCSKSRQTLALLEQKGATPQIVEYLKTGLSERTVTELVAKLGGDARLLLRVKESAYEQQGLSGQSTTRNIIAAIVAAPILLERPIVVHGERAAIGRPPEAVLEIL